MLGKQPGTTETPPPHTETQVLSPQVHLLAVAPAPLPLAPRSLLCPRALCAWAAGPHAEVSVS